MKDVVYGQASREYMEMAREFFPGGILHLRGLPEEVSTVFARGKGSHIWDVDGNEYLDYIIGAGPMILGHAHPEVVAAVKERVDMGTQFYQITDVSLELARKVVEAVPCAESIKFTNSGNESTYVALRLARAYTGKNKILKFEGGYHGTHDYTAWSTTPANPPDYPRGEPDSDGVPEVLRDYVLVVPFNDTDYVCSLIREHQDDLAAVIVEPFFRMIKPKPGFMEALRETTRECDVLLVFDEVVTGFRLAWGGAQELYGITPDLATLGKAIGGGFAVGAVVGPKEIMNRLDPALRPQGKYVMTSGTFSGNPITSTAGLATLGELEKPGTYDKLHRSGQRLRDGFRQVCEMLETPVQVLGEGPIVDILFTNQEIHDYRSSLEADRELSLSVGVEMIKRGVFHSPGGKFYISLAHTDEDLDETINVFEAALRTVR